MRLIRQTRVIRIIHVFQFPYVFFLFAWHRARRVVRFTLPFAHRIFGVYVAAVHAYLFTSRWRRQACNSNKVSAIYSSNLGARNRNHVPHSPRRVASNKSREQTQANTRKHCVHGKEV